MIRIHLKKLQVGSPRRATRDYSKDFREGVVLSPEMTLTARWFQYLGGGIIQYADEPAKIITDPNGKISTHVYISCIC
jgi:hypothetical protein